MAGHEAESIERAAWSIDPMFRDSPQFLCAPLSERAGREVVLKVETFNPIRSFKGRGADWFAQQLPEGSPSLVCASAGNFGQGLAYVTARRGIDLEVFAAETASPVKVDRMRELGALVRLVGRDLDEAKAAARDVAARDGRRFVEDGREPAITEGAGTIAVELGRWPEAFDAVVVPIGNGALVNGVGRWLRARSPGTRVVGVCPQGAPAMARSWAAGAVVATEHAETIADGVAVRVPVPEAVAELPTSTDEIHLVGEDEIVAAMRLLDRAAGLVAEPSGALALAALDRVPGQRLAVVVTGSNVSEEQQRWLRSDPDEGKAT